ncbi:MAG: DNA replication/repair protein RecF [Vulcanimicrobiaceae bacterium]
MRLALANVRNYGSLEFVPSDGLNVIVGANGQGKSNLLEAIGILATGKSFRTQRERELMRHGEHAAHIAGEARVRFGEIRLACALELSDRGLRKRYTVNGEPVRYARYLGRTRVVSFAPADLQLAAGPPALRRGLLNAALAQASPPYYGHLVGYARALAQKNALLRGTVDPDQALCEVYDGRLAQHGAPLMLARAQYVAELGHRARAAYAGWVAGDRAASFEIAYRPSVAVDADHADGVSAQLSAALVAGRARERNRKAALVGPHRDDVELTLGGESLAAFGSQGERRTAVLALKVAEYGVAAARSGDPPILLLDDVLSELDAARQRAFLHGVGAFEQAFVTATDGLTGVAAAATFAVADASVRPC